MMLTKAFNCKGCKKPFGCKEGEPKSPWFDAVYGRAWCTRCYSTFAMLNRGLMDFLDQRAFKMTDAGYEYTLPINEPKCFGCQGNIKVFEGAIAFLGQCGHYLCHGCYYQTQKKGKECLTCNMMTEGPSCFPETLLSVFTHEIVTLEKTRRVEEEKAAPKEISALRKRVKEIDHAEVEKAEDRKKGAIKDCSDCGREQEIEYLYSCKDCHKDLCGVCSFDSHHSHAVVKLLGIELDQMEQRSDKRYTENLEGLHGNLKYIQTTIDEAVEKVMKAGKERLAEIKACTKHRDAQKIVVKVDDAADKFEKYCEVYIPVARQLATCLTELGEDLMKNKD